VQNGQRNLTVHSIIVNQEHAGACMVAQQGGFG
jgi:hypothetical protein